MKAGASPLFVSYIRVSTQRQAESGLGSEAQRIAVNQYVTAQHGSLICEIEERQSGRKGLQERAELARALGICRDHRAALVIGKLDRLARDVRHFLELIDDSGVDIRFADLPDVSPNSAEGRMLLVNMANFAEFEARRISNRTKAALEAAKKRGAILGAMGPTNLQRNIRERQVLADEFAAGLTPVFRGFIQQGLSQRRMVEALNSARLPASRGGKWSVTQVQRVIARIDLRNDQKRMARA